MLTGFDLKDKKKLETRLRLFFTCIFIQLVIYNSSPLAGSDASSKRSGPGVIQQAPSSLLKIISVEMDNVPMEKALTLIALEGDFKLNYNKNRIPVYKKVSVKMNNVPAINALQEVLDKTGTELIITRGGQFVVIPRKAGSNSPGMIIGRVSESINNRIIAGVFIKLVGTGFSSLSDEKGEFKIINIPAGSYMIKFSAPGFKTVIKKNVVIGPKRIFPVNIRMEIQLPWFREKVDVLRSYFHVNEKNPVSVVNVSSQEVCRAPGTAGGVSRMLRAMPGITSIADNTNELIIRGGCPLENGFYIDNIEVPNINHLPALGSNGGSYSALHPDLIQNIDFFSGGFSSDFGDYLSAITEITFREGDRDKFKGEMDISAIMGGVVLEGPLAKGRGAFLLSSRKSWLNWLDEMDIIDDVPETFDSQIKVTYDITPQHKINLLHFHGSGAFKNHFCGTTVLEETKYNQNTSGINWVSNWSEKFLSNTALSYSSLKRINGETNALDQGKNKIWDIDDSAKAFSLRNTSLLILNNQNKLEFGFQVKHEAAKAGYFIYKYMNDGGNIFPGKRENTRFQRTRCSLFFSYTNKPFKRLISTLGLRADYSFTHDVFHLSPRFSLTYQIRNDLSLNGGFGVFYQAFPMNYLAYTPGVINLKDMKAIHYILGLEYFPGAGTKISLETYNKEYKNLPINPDFPYALFSDWVLDRSVDNIYGPSAYFTQTPLSDEASGYSRGVELLIQKKLINKFHGIFSATYFRSRYKDLSGIVRNRMYDNCYVINLAGVYKPTQKWEFSARWTLMGGAPYTPVDVKGSAELSSWTLDQSKFHSRRYPSYSSLNLRINRLFDVGKLSLLFYLEVWNVFDKKNIYMYWWSKDSWTIDMEDQLSTLPVFGIEVKF